MEEWYTQLWIKQSGLSLGWGHGVVFLAVRLYSHCASLHPGGGINGYQQI